MKIILLFVLALGFSWLGLNSVLTAVANWPLKGAAVPLIAGFLLLALGARFWLALLRQYIGSGQRRS